MKPRITRSQASRIPPSHKRCPQCEKTLPLDLFWRSASNHSGRYSYCKLCAAADKAAYYLANRDRKIQSARDYRNRNKELISTRKREKYLKLKSDPVAWKKFMDSRGLYMRNKLRTNVAFRLLSAARNRLWYVVKGTAKIGRTVGLLGCTPEFLKEYLENQFMPGWTWADWGSVFEIDHIIPCSKFDMTDPEQQKRCFHYTNLQPLLKEVNRSKWNKIIAA